MWCAGLYDWERCAWGMGYDEGCIPWLGSMYDVLGNWLKLGLQWGSWILGAGIGALMGTLGDSWGCDDDWG